MNRFKTFLSALIVSTTTTTAVLAQDNQLTAAQKAQGWVSLFDGKNTTAWRNYQKSDIQPGWVVENGALKLEKAGAGDLISKQAFGDFDLYIDWKISEAGNSGIFILADEKGKMIYSHAPEIQILDNEKAHDNKIDTHLSGSLYDMVAVHPSALKPAGEWNTVRIKLQDKLLQIWQNDVMTTNVVIGTSTWDNLVAASKFADWNGFAANETGHLGLQDHGNVVWFKNMRIKEL